MDRADEWPPFDELPDSTKRWSLFCGQLIEAIEQKNRKLRAANTALLAADAFIGSLNPYALEDRSLGPLEQYKAAAEAWGKVSQK